jgi:hypothetical protein
MRHSPLLVSAAATLASSVLGAPALAGEFGLRVFRDRDAWLAEAREGGFAFIERRENFNAVTPQSLPNFVELVTGPRGVGLTANWDADVSIKDGGAPGSLDGTNFVDVRLSSSVPYMNMRLLGGAYAWAADFSSVGDEGGLIAQFGDVILDFGLVFGEGEVGFAGFVTSSIYEDVRFFADFEGESFAFDNVEWINLPAPSCALWGVAFVVAGGQRRRR